MRPPGHDGDVDTRQAEPDREVAAYGPRPEDRYAHTSPYAGPIIPGRRNIPPRGGTAPRP